MKINCAQRDLQKGIAMVSRAVLSRRTSPILGNILVEAKGDMVRLAATNFAITINCWIAAKVEEEGAITIPSWIIGEMVSRLRGNVELEVERRTMSVVVRNGNYKAKVRGLDAADYPLTHNQEGSQQTTLDVTTVRQMIDLVAFAASADESRQALCCVNVELAPDRLMMAATDGYRLSQRAVGIETQGLTAAVLIPAASLGELARIAAEADERQVMGVDVRANGVTFGVMGKANFVRAEITTQLVDARFPDYRAIIPQTVDTSVVVDRAMLLRSLQTARLFARGNDLTVSLAVETGNALKITATDAEMGDSVDAIGATVTGPPIDILVNVVFLLDLLTRLDVPEVVIEMTTAKQPLVVRPAGGHDDEFIYVVMPMNKT